METPSDLTHPITDLTFPRPITTEMTRFEYTCASTITGLAFRSGYLCYDLFLINGLDFCAAFTAKFCTSCYLSATILTENHTDTSDHANSSIS